MSSDMPEDIYIAKTKGGYCANVAPMPWDVKYIRADLVPQNIKCFYTDTPKGDFLAIYGDLSGANYFYPQSDGTWSSDEIGIVDADWFADAGYLWFIEHVERGTDKA